MYKRGFLRSIVVYLKDLSPYYRQFSPYSESQNIIRVNLLGNHSTSYYYVVKTVLTYIPNLIIGPTVVPTTRFRYIQGSGFIRVLVIKFFKPLGAAYKVPGRVPGQVQIIAFLLDIVLQRSFYQFIGQYFINFLFIVAINLNQQGRLILLSRQQVIYSLLQLIQQKDRVDFN